MLSLSSNRFKTYDLAVIGGGPGGYVAAIKAAQNGMKVACIEERKTLGGTCLNVGCIPTKALLHGTHIYHEAMNSSNWGVPKPTQPQDFAKLSKMKDNTVNQLTKGIEFLFKKNKIDFINSRGTFKNSTTIGTNGEDINFTHGIIATGSVPSNVPGGFMDVDEKMILSSTGALALKAVPKRLLIVGGGVIGLEFATVFARLGSKVDVIEFMPTVGGPLDTDVAAALVKNMKAAGVTLHTSVGVCGCKVDGDVVALTAKNKKGETLTFTGDKVLVAVGRRANTTGLGSDEIGIKKDKMGRIIVDEEFNTSVRGIKAIGDCIPGPMLAHKAEEDGIMAVETILGKKHHVNYSRCPGVIYIDPEVAVVGATEQQLKQDKVDYVKGNFPMAANSRSKCMGVSTGFVKILADKNTRKILGGHVMGVGAGDIIHELVLSMTSDITIDQLAGTIHAHPTVAEALKEAAMQASCGKAIHM